MLFCLSFAFAADPAIEGLRVAVGAGIKGGIGYDGVSPPSVGGGLRLHLGRATMDVLGGVGYTTDDSSSADYGLDDDGEAEVQRHAASELSGLSGAVGLRLSWMVTRNSPVGIGLGVFGGYETRQLSGPVFEDVGTEVKEVGVEEQRSVDWGVGPSLVAIWWMNERLALSGVIDAQVWAMSTDRGVFTRTDGSADYDAEVDEDTRTSLGAWPSVGLYVHLLL